MKTLYVVVSKMKKFIRESNVNGLTGFNTSSEAIDVLSDFNEKIMAEAVKFAQHDGRKTVMKRDMEAVFGSTPLHQTSTKKQDYPIQEGQF
jgi:histone H3/H4